MATMERLWRVGRSQPINLYRDGVYVGVIFAGPELAAEVAETLNLGEEWKPWTPRFIEKEAE